MHYPLKAVLTCLCASLAIAAPQAYFEDWTKSFSVRTSDLVSTGTNKYFGLTPGRVLELRGGDTDLVVTVTNDTQMIDGVQTRVVEERESEGGKLIEISRNFFAIDPKTKDVYYFGEDVDMYQNGKVVSHDGAWKSGVKGAKFGLMMPGAPKQSRGYYQEIAPGVAMDRARIVGLDVSVETPAGRFEHCLKIEETTPLEPKAKEYKYYAPGIGLIQDADLKLVKRP